MRSMLDKIKTNSGQRSSRKQHDFITQAYYNMEIMLYIPSTKGNQQLILNMNT